MRAVASAARRAPVGYVAPSRIGEVHVGPSRVGRAAMSRPRGTEAEVSALHAKLEDGVAVRGASGGLGFEKKSSKKQKAAGASKAGKSAPAAREFASTTSGAVAAGHWDPWARPVEFKMREANRKVGGLYTMFVKGGTMGGTITESQDGAGTSGLTRGAKRKRDAAAAAPAQAGASFAWKREIRSRLQEAAGQSLKMKALRRAVVGAAAATVGGAKADLKATFERMLRKTARAEVDAASGTVRLRPKR